MASTDLVVGSGGAVLFVFAGIRRADATETSQTHDRRGNTRVYRGFSLISFRLDPQEFALFLTSVVVMVFICGVLLSRLVRYGHTSIYNRTRVIYLYLRVSYFSSWNPISRVSRRLSSLYRGVIYVRPAIFLRRGFINIARKWSYFADHQSKSSPVAGHSHLRDLSVPCAGSRQR